MANYVWTITWTKPNGVSTDITDLVLLDQLGSLNRGVSAPDELFAFVTGDVTVTCDDKSKFFTDTVKTSATDSSTLQDTRSKIAVDFIRNGIRKFKGYVLPQNIKLDPRMKTATFTVLGPMRLADMKSAKGIRRYFSGIPVVASIALEGASSFTTSAPIPELTTDDVLEIGFENSESGTTRVVVASYDTLTNIVTTQAPLERTIAASEPIIVATPYLRNRLIEDLVAALFTEAGITNYSIRYSGLLSDQDFVSPFSTAGTTGFGVIRGLKYALDVTQTRHHLVASFTTEIRSSQGIATGFNFLNFPTSQTPGHVKDFLDQGGLTGEPVYGLTSSNFYRQPSDSVRIDNPGLLTHPTFTRSYDVVRTAGGQVYLYELEVRQPCRDLNYDPSTPGNPATGYCDEEAGGLDWSTAIRRYVTADLGVTWAVDAAWIPLSTLTLTPPASQSGSYSYRVNAFNAGGFPVGSSNTVAITNGPNNIGPGGNRIDLSWTASPNATTYRIYRITASSGNGPGLIATQAGTTLSDTNLVVAGQIPTDLQAPGEWIIAFGTSSGGRAAIAEDITVCARPMIATAATTYDHVLYFSSFYGTLVGGTPDTRMYRIRIDGANPQAFDLRHLNSSGCRAMFTRSYGAYTNANRRIEVYYIDKPSAAIVKVRDNGTNESFAEALYLQEFQPIVKSIRWNGVDGSPSRIACLFSQISEINGAPIGSGYIVMTPGNDSLSAPAGVFTLESQERVTERVISYDTKAQSARQQRVVDIMGNFVVPLQSDVPGFICPWKISIGGNPVVLVWALYLGGEWYVAGKNFTGFIKYADFDGMSCSKALQELAFVANAFVNVDWTGGGNPTGSFISRDLQAPTAPKLLANLDYSEPAGSPQDIITSAVYNRTWEQSYPWVRVKGSTEEVVAESGQVDAEQQGLEVESRFCELNSLAEVIARNLLTFYGPSLPVRSEPTVSPVGTSGTATYRYFVMASLIATPLGQGMAITDIGQTNKGNTTLSGGNFNRLNYALYPGALWYHVFRYQVIGAAVGIWSQLGYLGNTNGAQFDDLGLAPDPFYPLIGFLKQPRQSAEIEVVDDGTNYYPRMEVQFPDMLGHTDLGEPTEVPPVPPNNSLPPRWWIENIDEDLASPVIRLQVVEKDVPV